MQLDLNKLFQTLRTIQEEEMLDASEVNPYLLNKVLKPLLDGKELCYGDIDFSAFERDDLRVLSDYCDRRSNLSSQLQKLTEVLIGGKPAACKGRAFC